MSLLLSAVNTVSTEVITAILIAIIIGGMIYYIYNSYTENKLGKAKLDKFLDSIQDIVKKHIMEAIDKFDFSAIKESFAEIQATFIEGLYNDIWDLCIAEIDKLKGDDDILYALLKKIITKEKIKDYVITIYSDESIQEKLHDIYNTALKEKIDEIEAEDKRLEVESDKYDNEEENDDSSTVEKLDPSKVPGVDEEEIIPPVEEESDTVSKDDPTVEIISEDITDKLNSDTDNE